MKYKSFKIFVLAIFVLLIGFSFVQKVEAIGSQGVASIWAPGFTLNSSLSADQNTLTYSTVGDRSGSMRVNCGSFTPFRWETGGYNWGGYIGGYYVDTPYLMDNGTAAITNTAISGIISSSDIIQQTPGRAGEALCTDSRRYSFYDNDPPIDNGIQGTFTTVPKTLNVSSLPSGTYNLSVTLCAENTSTSGFPNCSGDSQSFTISRAVTTYTVSASAGTGGSVTAASYNGTGGTNNTASSVTVVPPNSKSANFTVAPSSPSFAVNTAIVYSDSSSGIPGDCPLNGVWNNLNPLPGDADTYTTGDVSADCTYTFNFSPVVNGSCGTTPTHYNCATGTSASNVSGSTAWTWGCNGSGGGTSTGPTDCSETKSLPDLTASVPTPTTTAPGTITFSSTISNNGTASTVAGFTNLFQVSSSSSGSSPTNYTSSSSALLAGANVSTSTPITLSAGTYYIRACADNNASFVGTITESNEGNNCSSASPWTTVTVNSVVDGICGSTHYTCSAGTSVSNVSGATTWTWGCNGSGGGTSTGATDCSETKPQPDLTASAPTPSTTVPGPITFSSTITNLDAGSTITGFTNLFQISSSSSGSSPTNYTTTTASAVPGGGTTTTSKSITLVAGTYYLRACADNNASFTGTITESDETNNCSSNAPWTAVTVVPAGLSDLTASAPTPVTAGVNVSQTFSSTISNIGTGSTGTGFTNLFQTSASSDGSSPTNYTTSTLSSLAAGGTVATSKSITFTSAGTYYIRACADNNASFVGTITESNEGNNCSSASPWTTVTVSVPAPDLTASTPTPVMATPGVAQTYTSTISNIGTTSTLAGFTNLFQISSFSGGSSPTNYTTTTLSAVGAGGTTTTSKSLTLAAGTYYMRACADNNASFVGTITESNENNNCSSGTPWTAVTVGAACSIQQGNSCNPANSCGMTNPGGPGTLGCDGVTCSISAPSDSLCSPGDGNGTGACGAAHYACNPSSTTSTGRTSSTSKWTWNCGSTACTELKKKPIFIEN